MGGSVIVGEKLKNGVQLSLRRLVDSVNNSL